MRPRSRIDGRVAILVIALLAVAPLAFGGCGSSGGGGGNPPPPGPLAVSASPAGGNYAGTQNVSLTAAGEGSSTATIYYTTDLSVPEPMVGTTMEYTGPIAIDTETVLKFYAVPTTGDPTDVVNEGYTFATGGIGLEWTQSGHGDIAAEAWRHWDEDGEVQTSCAKCHSGEGFMDWGLDGTVDAAAALPMGLDVLGLPHGDPEHHVRRRRHLPGARPGRVPLGCDGHAGRPEQPLHRVPPGPGIEGRRSTRRRRTPRSRSPTTTRTTSSTSTTTRPRPPTSAPRCRAATSTPAKSTRRGTRSARTPTACRPAPAATCARRDNDHTLDAGSRPLRGVPHARQRVLHARRLARRQLGGHQPDGTAPALRRDPGLRRERSRLPGHLRRGPLPVLVQRRTAPAT